ncbi:hypothetical protein EVJ50_12010 [Synechococcus sp. RSCCF101]|uniref:hypothetical protein n=1 Tax=Synechococcus sp. RSCCF101 TaxID=2511069 RepID=UPI00124883AE|nr:hypothetical protein [Synechococcus sp. RSCCF101]QEY32852.1 hypothetical protein EVJ50_12010 [Synechococcus sp. RSCCF101]
MASSGISPSSGSELRVMEALKDGWEGFKRAPGPFVVFTLIWGVVNLIGSGLQQASTFTEDTGMDLIGLVVSLVGSLVTVVVSLWGATGMLRGTWEALEGGRPELGSFLRWDGGAMVRLFLRQLTLGILMLVILVLIGLLGAGAYQLAKPLVIIPALVAFAVLLYLGINQMFLVQIALLEGPGPVATIERGRRTVDPQWGRFFLLALLLGVLVMAGVALCGVGLLVATPLVSCVATAAYRQVFGTEDLTGLMSSSGL